jgi:hypothetical protein
MSAWITGCGTPGAPQPPSLDLPDRVADLSAVRSGNEVSLTWTMPRKSTDKLLLKADIEVSVCRREETGPCNTVGRALMVAPGNAGKLNEALPSALASGAPRALSYFVELKNRKGKSAGPSNAAVVLAGEAPSPIAGLKAEVRKDGVILRWEPKPQATAVRLQRKLLSAPPPAKSNGGLLAPAPEPLEENLLVPRAAEDGRAIDNNIRLGQTYEYRAQRVSRINSDDKTVELAGELSQPIRVETTDIFPPTVPTGLSAVASIAESGTEAAIDLSWQPDTEPDLAGYIVYRREGDADWQRISPTQQGVAPAFHDSHVQPGRTYRYAVSAISQSGHESQRSAEAEETVPNP